MPKAEGGEASGSGVPASPLRPLRGEFKSAGVMRQAVGLEKGRAPARQSLALPHHAVLDGNPDLSCDESSAMMLPMGTKYLTLNEGLYRYIERCRSDAEDPLLQELREETAALGQVSECQISDEQGTFLGILVAAIGASSAIEVGTFTGYSSVCIARALPSDGRLLCLDQSEPWTAVARKYWAQAGLQDRIELRLGPAIPLLERLEPGRTFDFVFIDAEKTEYDAYYELLLPRVRRNGLILFDNMLWKGRVGNGRPSEAAGRAIDELNCKLACDRRIESVLLSIADGIQLCRKKL